MDSRILLGELKAFRKQTVRDLKELRGDVKSLMAFRWRVISLASAASFFATLVVELLRH